MTDAALNSGSLVDRDQAKWEKKLEPNKVELLAHAAKKTGRNPISLGLEAMKLKRGRQKIQLDEYIKFGLYDQVRHTQQERDEFISFMLHNACIQTCNDVWWFGVTEDKWLSSVTLAADGIPTPEVVMVIDKTDRSYHGTQAVANADMLRARLQDMEFPLFCKDNRGLMSVGVWIMDGADDSHVHLREQGPLTYQAFLDQVIGDEAFIVQKFVHNHEFLQRFSSSAATIRMVNMWSDEGLYIPAAVLKLPSASNLADNFWRPGNLVCNINPNTGEVLTIVGAEGPELVNYDAHPETGDALIGEVLPHWEALLEVNERVARLHKPLKYQSTDMAITDDGPVVVEVNAGSSFSLPQYASGKGFMTPKVRSLFRQWGCDFIWA